MRQTNQFLYQPRFADYFWRRVFGPDGRADSGRASGFLAVARWPAAGKFHWFMAIELSVLACLIADYFWFYLGRYQGTRVLNLLCRMSLEPDSCVRKTTKTYSPAAGWRGLSSLLNSCPA